MVDGEEKKKNKGVRGWKVEKGKRRGHEEKRGYMGGMRDGREKRKERRNEKRWVGDIER